MGVGIVTKTVCDCCKSDIEGGSLRANKITVDPSYVNPNRTLRFEFDLCQECFVLAIKTLKDLKPKNDRK